MRTTCFWTQKVTRTYHISTIRGDRYSFKFREDFTVNLARCVEHPVEVPTTTADVFRLVLGSLNIVGEEWELLASVDRLCVVIQPSEELVLSLWRQIS